MPSDVSPGLSPCAHTPQCPPPACLPASLWAQPVSADPEARGGTGELNTATGERLGALLDDARRAFHDRAGPRPPA
ncbi:hypothetical protein [Nonomuraea sp. NPDC003214]